MMYSMTGFGRGESQMPGRRVTVEIRSINNRYCDIQLRMPRLIGSLEIKIRQAISLKAFPRQNRCAHRARRHAGGRQCGTL
jgi:uncharacterized protein (TIGR00255 family)